jgi:hypothetical protein
MKENSRDGIEPFTYGQDIAFACNRLAITFASIFDLILFTFAAPRFRFLNT